MDLTRHKLSKACPAIYVIELQNQYKAHVKCIRLIIAIYQTLKYTIK